MSKFNFFISADSIQKELNQKAEDIAAEIKQSVERLAVQTHGKVIEMANQDLQGYHRDAFLGENSENVRWFRASDNIWVVEIDEKSMIYDEGSPVRDMATDNWLLKGNGLKTAKDGCVLNPRNKVLTITGWKKIKDIVPGDMVLTHSGKYREVKELLVQPAGIGTEYVRFTPKSFDTSLTSRAGKEFNDLTHPSISLTLDHLVLTPDGWKAAGELKNNDLIATPSDLKRLCKVCGSSLPINTLKVEYCLNNRCSRIQSHIEGRAALSGLTKEDRVKISKMANAKAKLSGIFNRPDWGSRNPEVFKKMRDGSAKAMRSKLSSGKWQPEVFFEKCLNELGVEFLREVPIKTDRDVKSGYGKTRKSTMFLDFYIPKLNLAIELDGVNWHSSPEAKERDSFKDAALKRDGVRLLRVPSHKIYRRGPRLAKYLNLWLKNHSGELGIAWVKVKRLKKGVVDRADHVYAKKYDICLEAEEHSFCCETVFIHNSTYKVIPFTRNVGPKVTNSNPHQAALDAMAKGFIKRARTPEGKRISTRTLERNPDGTPKVGIIHKIPTQAPFTQSQAPDLFSRPRSKEEAISTGLPEHSGIFKLQGLAVAQRKHGAKIKKEAITFRVVSSKHFGHRWRYPAIQGKNFLDRALQWAKTEAFPIIMRDLKQKYLT